MTHPIKIPLLNPNEPEAVLTALHVTEGQQVTEGDPLCTLETTKSTAEVEAPAAGFIAGLCLEEGAAVIAGQTLCYLAESPDWAPPEAAAPGKPHPGAPGETPPGLRITQPALALARQKGLNLTDLPLDRLVTEKFIDHLSVGGSAKQILDTPAGDFDHTALIIYGCGGHGKALVDLVRTMDVYRIVGFLDDGVPGGETIMGLPVLGGAEALPGLYQDGIRLAVNAVGGIGNLSVRERVFLRLAENGFGCPAVVHPTAFVEPSASLSPGVQVFPHAYVGTEARLGYGCIVNTGAIVSHDCALGDYTNISPGVMLAGEVQVGPGTLIGMGVTVNLRVTIGAGAKIGNGATVKSDVPEGGLVQAGAVWP